MTNILNEMSDSMLNELLERAKNKKANYKFVTMDPDLVIYLVETIKELKKRDS